MDLMHKTANYDVTFKEGERNIVYSLKYENGKVTTETLTIDGEPRLDREAGKLYYNGLKQMLPFKTDETILAVARRDSEQQAFVSMGC